MRKVSLAVAVVAGCGMSSDRAVEVNEPNDLGVTTLTTERVVDDAKDVFTLRGLTADGQERATVRLTRGHMGTDISLPGDGDLGSELVISANGIDGRWLSRETRTIFVDPSVQSPAAAKFLALAKVSSTLASEADIQVAAPVAHTGDSAYSTSNCAASQLLNTNTAYECCWSNLSLNTVFHRADQQTVTRHFNSYGTGCKASDGVSSCAGDDCFYGPLGFSRPSVGSSGGAYAYIYDTAPGQGYGTCGVQGLSYDHFPWFGDVNGSNSVTNCPGGGGSGGWVWAY